MLYSTLTIQFTNTSTIELGSEIWYLGSTSSRWNSLSIFVSPSSWWGDYNIYIILIEYKRTVRTLPSHICRLIYNNIHMSGISHFSCFISPHVFFLLYNKINSTHINPENKPNVSHWWKFYLYIDPPFSSSPHISLRSSPTPTSTTLVFPKESMSETSNIVPILYALCKRTSKSTALG